MNALVAINALFSILKAAIVIPRIAPPVPSTPAAKPDKLPPIIDSLGSVLQLNFS